MSVKAVVRYQSDTNIVREFFEGEYRQDPQPSTYFEVNRFWQNFSVDTYVQPQVNNFLETEERLPDVRLNGQRQQLWESPVYYESAEFGRLLSARVWADERPVRRLELRGRPGGHLPETAAAPDVL